MKLAELQQSITCPFCKNQGLDTKASILKGAEGTTKMAGTIRYGCSQGHKFAQPLPKMLTS